MKVKRNGITLTEALAAIAVASIGLFGVMAIIPLAALQTKRGLEIDEVVNIGNSAIEMTKIYQMTDVSTWTNSNGIVIENINTDFLPGPDSTHILGFCYVIDPLLIKRPENSAFTNNIGTFPYAADGSNLSNAATGNTFEPAVRISIDNAYTPNYAAAQTIFQSVDDLVLDEVTDKLKLPPQKYNRTTPAANPLRRSATRKISWSVMLNADEYASDIYRMYVMVFQSRDTLVDVDADGAGDFIGEQTWDVVFNGSGAGGGEVTVSNPRGTRQLDDGIFVDDWMLLTDNLPTQATLINNPNDPNDDLVFPRWELLRAVDPSTNPIPASNAQFYFKRPIQPFNWYRVARVGSQINQRLSLVGPDFNASPQFEFVTVANINNYLAGNITLAQLEGSALFVDRQVFGTVFSGLEAVYEKTIRLENNSIWR